MINPLSLTYKDIDARDIAHHLACINRWCGALKEPISVAQHSLHVFYLCCGTGYELEALLHDASEAYLGDITKWVKMHEHMKAYREVEKAAHETICRRFNVSNRIPDIVEHADRLMINLEGSFGFDDWVPLPGFPLPDGDMIAKAGLVRAWPWQVAEKLYLDTLRGELRGRTV
jgi:hypothetical protein